MFLTANDTYEWIIERKSKINQETTLKIKLEFAIGWVIIKHWEERDVFKWKQFESDLILSETSIILIGFGKGPILTNKIIKKYIKTHTQKKKKIKACIIKQKLVGMIFEVPTYSKKITK